MVGAGMSLPHQALELRQSRRTQNQWGIWDARLRMWVRATARGLEEMDTRSCAPWLTVESLLVGEAGVVCACVPVALLAYKDGEDDLS
jgi:hypothetical protein